MDESYPHVCVRRGQKSFALRLCGCVPQAAPIVRLCSLSIASARAERSAPRSQTLWGRKVVQNQGELADIKAALNILDRKFTKVQSRVLLCSEQLRALRKENAELRNLSGEALVEQGSALVDVQEQANSLQTVLSSLQDVVVRQVKVRTPHQWQASSLYAFDSVSSTCTQHVQ